MFEEIGIGNRTYLMIPAVGLCDETITDEELVEKAKAMKADNGEEEFAYAMAHIGDFQGKGVDGRCFLFTGCAQVEHGLKFYPCVYKQPAHNDWLRHKATNKVWGKDYYLLQRVDVPATQSRGQLGQ